MTRRPVRFFVVWLLAAGLLTGCWSQKELTNLALISAIGVDRLDNGKYLLTFQIVNSLNIPGSAQNGGGGQGPSVNVYQTTGKSVTEALRQASSEVSRRIYFAHVNLLLIGEDTARDGIYPLLDVFERHQEFRNTATVAIARNGKAEDVLKILTPIDRIPANKINKTLEFAEKNSGGKLKISMAELIDTIDAMGKEAIVGGFKLIGDPKKGKTQDNLNQTALSSYLIGSDIGLIKNGKLIGWVEGSTARVLTWLLQKTQGTTIPLDWKGHRNAISIGVTDSQAKAVPVIRKGKPEMEIDVRLQGSLYELDVPINVMNLEQINALEKAYEKKVEDQFYRGIRAIQQDQCDVFGFGEMIHRHDPKAWQAVKTNWNEKGFARLKVNVHAHVVISHSQLRNNSFRSNIK